MKKSSLRIGILGLTHLGLTYSAGLADCGFTVTGFDFDKKSLDHIRNGKPDVFEPGVNELLKKHLGKNLFLTSSYRRILKENDYLFITYDLYLNNSGNLDLEKIEKFLKIIPGDVLSRTIIVISSQVPLGTSRKYFQFLKSATGIEPKIIYFPENLKIGKALDSFRNPERIIIGITDHKIGNRFKSDFSIFKCPVVSMDLESAEMTKHALNAYLATCISFSSELSDLCNLTGANMNDVIRAVKTDRRVGELTPINPGLGYSGPTLSRDLRSLIDISEGKKYPAVLFRAVEEVNRTRLSILLIKIKKLLPGLKGKNIGILGLTYKADSNIIKQSMSLALSLILYRERANVSAFDPLIGKSLPGYPFLRVNSDLNKFFGNLDLIILMTAWPEFRNLSPAKISSSVKTKNIIDTRNFLDQDKWRRSGFTYQGIGI